VPRGRRTARTAALALVAALAGCGTPTTRAAAPATPPSPAVASTPVPPSPVTTTSSAATAATTPSATTTPTTATSTPADASLVDVSACQARLDAANGLGHPYQTPLTGQRLKPFPAGPAVSRFTQAGVECAYLETVEVNARGTTDTELIRQTRPDAESFTRFERYLTAEHVPLWDKAAHTVPPSPDPLTTLVLWDTDPKTRVVAPYLYGPQTIGPAKATVIRSQGYDELRITWTFTETVVIGGPKRLAAAPAAHPQRRRLRRPQLRRHGQAGQQRAVAHRRHDPQRRARQAHPVPPLARSARARPRSPTPAAP